MKEQRHCANDIKVPPAHKLSKRPSSKSHLCILYMYKQGEIQREFYEFIADVSHAINNTDVVYIS